MWRASIAVLLVVLWTSSCTDAKSATGPPNPASTLGSTATVSSIPAVTSSTVGRAACEAKYHRDCVLANGDSGYEPVSVTTTSTRTITKADRVRALAPHLAQNSDEEIASLGSETCTIASAAVSTNTGLGNDLEVIAAAISQSQDVARALIKVMCPEYASVVSETPATHALGPALTYEVEGQGEALVTYSSDGFSQEQRTVRLPWNYSPPGSPTYPTLLAQLHSSGTITCRIRQDGSITSENTSSGAYVVVTCGP
jgi:hypothetical protein